MQATYTKEIPMLDWCLLYTRLNKVMQSIGGCAQKKSVKGRYLICVGQLHFQEKL